MDAARSIGVYPISSIARSRVRPSDLGHRAFGFEDGLLTLGFHLTNPMGQIHFLPFSPLSRALASASRDRPSLRNAARCSSGSWEI